MKKSHYDWIVCLPFYAVHVVAVAGVAMLGFSWKGLAWAVGLYVIRMFGVTAGYHRYFAHRTYRTGRVFRFFLAVLAQSSVQKGVLWWAAHHRDHHRYSDTPKDPHSYRDYGFWYSHVGWILARDTETTYFDRIEDMARYPELRWLNRYHLVPGIALAAGCLLVGGWPALIWGFFVSTTVLWHGVFSINSLSHVWGTRRYVTTDGSRNNPLLAILTLGEGWHNNHHHYPRSVRQGFLWWEYDFTYYVLRALAAVGIVWDLHVPSAAVVAGETTPAAARRQSQRSPAALSASPTRGATAELPPVMPSSPALARVD